jgi:hypothetical protein
MGHFSISAAAATPQAVTVEMKSSALVSFNDIESSETSIGI